MIISQVISYYVLVKDTKFKIVFVYVCIFSKLYVFLHTIRYSFELNLWYDISYASLNIIVSSFL